MIIRVVYLVWLFGCLWTMTCAHFHFEYPDTCFTRKACVRFSFLAIRYFSCFGMFARIVLLKFSIVIHDDAFLVAIRSIFFDYKMFHLQ